LLFGATKHLSGRKETTFQSIEPFAAAQRCGVANGAAQSVVHSRHRLFAIPSRDATAGDDEALPMAAASGQQRLVVYRPAFSMGHVSHLHGRDDELRFYFFQSHSSQGVDVFRIDPKAAGSGRSWRGTTPTVTYPYDGPRGDGASCMIMNERLAPNRAYFNLVLEALEGDRTLHEGRVTEIKIDGNRLRCYGGWAVEDSTTVAPTVHQRRWFKLDAVLEDGPPPRLLLRVDGQLLYAMPLAMRVRLRSVVLKGWGNRPGRSYYARLAITDSVACAAARLVSLWLLRRANSDVALVVLAFAVPAPLLDLLRANSTALRGKRRVPSDRGTPFPTFLDLQRGNWEPATR